MGSHDACLFAGARLWQGDISLLAAIFRDEVTRLQAPELGSGDSVLALLRHQARPLAHVLPHTELQHPWPLGSGLHSDSIGNPSPTGALGGGGRGQALSVSTEEELLLRATPGVVP